MKSPFAKHLKPTLLCTAIAAFSASYTSYASAAVVVIPKPLTQTTAAEFGKRVARAGNYALASSTQATAMLGNIPCMPDSPKLSCFQGLVAVYKDKSTTPERVYQFPGQHTPGLENSPGADPLMNWSKAAGDKLAISDNWLAFSANEIDTSGSITGEKLYLVGKNNPGTWNACPTTGGVVDCNNASQPLVSPGINGEKPLLEIPLTGNFALGTGNFDLGNDHLAMQNGDRLKTYTYSRNSHFWFEDSPTQLPLLDSTAILAIDGDRMLVAQPEKAEFSNGGQGTLYVLKFNATTRTWDWKSIIKLPVGATHFGYKIAMKDGHVIAAADGLVKFYEFSNPTFPDHLVEVSSVSTPRRVLDIEISGTSALIQTEYPSGSLDELAKNELAKTYTFNTSLKKWDNYGSVYSSDFPRGENILGFDGIFVNYANAVSAHDFGLSNGLITMGFRGYDINNTRLLGAIFQQDFSATNANRSCLVSANKVSNCEFNSPYQNWSVSNFNGANSSNEYNNQSLNVHLYNSGPDLWSVQARTWVNLSNAGNYTVRFRAKKSSTDFAQRTLQLSLGHNGAGDNNWTAYAQLKSELSTEWQTFTYSLKNIPVDYNAVLDFNLGKSSIAGGQEDSISIDSVLLTKD